MQQALEGPAAAGSALFWKRRALRSAGLVGALTARQQDVLAAMTDGLLSKQIAVRLGINEATVKMHRAALLKRLGVANSTAAVRIAVEASFGGALWAAPDIGTDDGVKAAV